MQGSKVKMRILKYLVGCLSIFWVSALFAVVAHAGDTKDWLEEHRTIRVGVPHNLMPLIGIENVNAIVSVITDAITVGVVRWGVRAWIARITAPVIISVELILVWCVWTIVVCADAVFIIIKTWAIGT